MLNCQVRKSRERDQQGFNEFFKLSDKFNNAEHHPAKVKHF